MWTRSIYIFSPSLYIPSSIYYSADMVRPDSVKLASYIYLYIRFMHSLSYILINYIYQFFLSSIDLNDLWITFLGQSSLLFPLSQSLNSMETPMPRKWIRRQWCHQSWKMPISRKYEYSYSTTSHYCLTTNRSINAIIVSLALLSFISQRNVFIIRFNK